MHEIEIRIQFEKNVKWSDIRPILISVRKGKEDDFIKKTFVDPLIMQIRWNLPDKNIPDFMGQGHYICMDGLIK